MTTAITPADRAAPLRSRDMITSLQRGLQILELLAAEPEGLPAKTISQRSGLNLSTCYHLLNTLIAAGYVVKSATTQRFGISGKIVFPAQRSADGAALIRLIMPYLQTLRDQTSEAVYLSTRSGSEIVVSAIVESPQMLRVSMLSIGFAGANHATAVGKAVLAHLDDYDVTAYLQRYGMPALTNHTHTEIGPLKEELALIRVRGYSLDLEECGDGICCVGAPIFAPHGPVIASIGIPLPATRYHTVGSRIIQATVETAAAINRALVFAPFTSTQRDTRHSL